jgi:hypothetical protein
MSAEVRAEVVSRRLNEPGVEALKTPLTKTIGGGADMEAAGLVATRANLRLWEEPGPLPRQCVYTGRHLVWPPPQKENA